MLLIIPLSKLYASSLTPVDLNEKVPKLDAELVNDA